MIAVEESGFLKIILKTSTFYYCCSTLCSKWKGYIDLGLFSNTDVKVLTMN